MTIDAQIKEIDGIIEQLIKAAASGAPHAMGAPQAQIRHYRIDSGQSVVETERYAAASIPGAIQQWKRLRQDLIQQKQGAFIFSSRSNIVISQRGKTT